MITLEFATESEGSKGVKYWKRRRQKRKKLWDEHYREYMDTEVVEVALPCTAREARKLGKEWFFSCLDRVKRKFPKQLIYFSRDICLEYELEAYQKKWICWYCLFEVIWQQLAMYFSWEGVKISIVLVDTEDNRAQYCCRKLVGKVQEIMVITRERRKWRNCEQEMEAEGMFLEYREKIPLDMKEKVLLDLSGEYQKHYGELEEHNSIIMLERREPESENWRNGVKGEHIVTGYCQSIHGEMVEERLAAIYMQSHNWKLRQVAETQEVHFSEKELENIRREYEWKLEGIKLANGELV